MNKNFPCKCGHLKEDHKGILIPSCRMCSMPRYYPQGMPKNLMSPIHYYQPDNLKYLEMVYNEQTL